MRARGKASRSRYSGEGGSGEGGSGKVGTVGVGAGGVGLELAAVGIPVLAGVLVLLGTLGADWVYDDLTIVAHNPEIRHFHLADLFTRWSRPTRTISLMFDWALFGENPFGYHVQNLAWHALCVALVYRLARRLLSPLAASAAALLFAVHPIHVEAVSSIANRKEMLVTAFSLLSMLAFAGALEREGRARVGWLVAVLVWTFLALQSKQVAAVLPGCWVAWELACVPRERRLLLRHPRLVAVGGLVLATAVGAVVLSWLDLSDLEFSRTYRGYWGEPSLGASMLTAAPAFWRYVGLLFWPAGLCADHAMALSTSLLEPRVLLAWTGLIGVGGAAFGLCERRPAVAFGLLWIGLQWLPVSNLVPITYLIADRYMYIVSVGFVIAAVDAALWLGELRPASRVMRGLGWAALGLAVVGLSWRTVDYQRSFADNRTLWTSVLECNAWPHRALNGLGAFAFEDGRHAEARRLYSEALAIKPDDSGALFNRANAHLKLGEWESAIADFDAALANGLRVNEWDVGRDLGQTVSSRRVESEAWFLRGRASSALLRVDDALRDYERALELRPDHLEARLLRAALLALGGRLAEAEADLRVARAQAPEDARVLFELGRVHQSRGEIDAAVEAYREATKLRFGQDADLSEESLRSIRSAPGPYSELPPTP